MAKAILPAGYNTPSTDEPLEIELHNPWFAALLAWLIPGAGHLYQGRTGKGLLFFICVLGTFCFGMAIGERKVVYASSPGDEPWRWQYCQLGVGLPAMPALLQRGRADAPLPHPILGDFMKPPSRQSQPLQDDSGNPTTQPNELAAWTIAMHPRYELGTVYTVIAGLLNVLVICDAYGGPLVLQNREKKKSDPDDECAGRQAMIELLSIPPLGAVVSMWYALPLVVSVSLVCAATRHELMRPIIEHAIRFGVWLLVFMAVFVALLAALEWMA